MLVPGQEQYHVPAKGAKARKSATGRHPSCVFMGKAETFVAGGCVLRYDQGACGVKKIIWLFKLSGSWGVVRRQVQCPGKLRGRNVVFKIGQQMSRLSYINNGLLPKINKNCDLQTSKKPSVLLTFVIFISFYGYLYYNACLYLLLLKKYRPISSNSLP